LFILTDLFDVKLKTFGLNLLSKVLMPFVIKDDWTFVII
jgi:hypothetical protein